MKQLIQKFKAMTLKEKLLFLLDGFIDFTYYTTVSVLFSFAAFAAVVYSMSHSV